MNIHHGKPTTSISDRKVENVSINALKLDPDNPRFGGLEKDASQEETLDFIVKQFGIEDVLASLATNGYFRSEPLVAKRVGKDLIVVEGNRRLAACLILANDPRAAKLANLRPERVSETWSPEGKLPVLIFDESEQQSLLPYLGVRHIVGSQPWDSFAKARWIDLVVRQGTMTLSDIERAIGDTNRTISRMLDGYRFATQLKESGHFKPEESKRRGKGSNIEYPFSWIYTLLDYSSVREYLDLKPRSENLENPIPKSSLTKAATAIAYMFGSREVTPVIRNSRQIADLADALSDPLKRDLLESGKNIDEVIQRSRPISDRLATLLRDAEAALKAAMGVVAEGTLPAKEAQQMIATANTLRNTANSLFKSLNSTAYPENSDAR